jgi:hypothetical protein
LPMSSAFLRAARTSSVSSPICLLAVFACLPAFFTCFATPLRPLPVPGIGIPRTFFGLLFRRVPSTTPPTSPAAAVARPVTTAVFDEPPEPPEPPLPAPALPALWAAFCALPPPDERADEPRPRDDAADDFRLEALEPLELLPRELEALLPFEDLARLLVLDEPLLDEPLLLGLEPFELRDLVFGLPWDRELDWAISPP